MSADRRIGQFPIGAAVTEEQLIVDPYSVYERLRRNEPISWIQSLGMWYVINYDDVSKILMDDEHFATGSTNSTIFDTFGRQILSEDGEEHRRLRVRLQPSFRPRLVHQNLKSEVEFLTDDLIEAFAGDGHAELRSQFARRLPVRTMLRLFGMPGSDEKHLRKWYDSFERALANFTWQPQIRSAAQRCVAEFHNHLLGAMRRASDSPDNSLTSILLNAPAELRLSDEEIKRNSSIILFGGISTVEALILNAVWAFSTYPNSLAQIKKDWSLLPNAIEEVIRWHSPVQSATRHVTKVTEFRGIRFEKGEVVNCMLGAANRDPEVFDNPDTFDIGRPFPRSQGHLGFAMGTHNCLGAHLARLESQIALRKLYERLPDLQIDPETVTSPRGYEFHQPNALYVAWGPSA